MDTPKRSSLKYNQQLQNLNYFNSSNELSPATTSIDLFCKKHISPVSNKKEEVFSYLTANIEHYCAICGVSFGLDELKSAPKLLPCGHNFCSECIFSLCLHREVSFYFFFIF